MEVMISCRTAALLIVAGCGGVEGPRVVRAPARAVVTDGLVDVGGVSLHLHCAGDGSPPVVFDAGLGNDGSVWGQVQSEVARFSRACVYDRAGLGYSGPAPKKHGNRQMARELHALLEKAGLSAPYVLVGHSLGGVNVRLFASEHPNEVAGMVLVDAVADEQPSRYWGLIPDRAMAEFRRGLRELPEGIDFDTFVAGIADMRASSRSIGSTPLVVLTRGREETPLWSSPELAERMLGAWHEMQAELSHLSTNSAQVVAENSHHHIQWEAPRLVVAAVRGVVEAARTHAHVDPKPLVALAAEGPRR